MRIAQEMEAGFRFAEKFDEVRVVSCYGSAQAKPEDSHYKLARDLGYKLAGDNDPLAVVTGGGPGIMEAANRGAFEAGGYSIGLGIYLDALNEEPNHYTTHRMDFYYFFARKVILARIAQAYVFFPGGVGTMDEFFEMLTLIATKKLHQEPLVLLMDSAYWNGLFSWLDDVVTKKYHAFRRESIGNMFIVDSAEEAYAMLDKIPPRITHSDSI